MPQPLDPPRHPLHCAFANTLRRQIQVAARSSSSSIAASDGADGYDHSGVNEKGWSVETSLVHVCVLPIPGARHQSILHLLPMITHIGSQPWSPCE